MKDWLPDDKKAAVCLSIDDVHPATSLDAYEAGGDLAQGALGHVLWLLDRQPQLHVTLFTTPDWRQTSPTPRRFLLSRVPWLKQRVHLAKVLPKGTLSVENHPAFVSFLNRMPRTEVAFHGLHHVHRGPHVSIEFQEQDRDKCAAMLREARRIFERAGLRFAPGMQPPGWHLPTPLREAASDAGIEWVAAARDIQTPVSRNAKTAMSGPRGMSLIYPEEINERGLLHFTSNFQATSPMERALRVVEAGGCLHIKGHIVKNALGHVALDGVDRLYMNYIDAVCSELAQRYGDAIWWTTLGSVAEHAMRRRGWKNLNVK